MTGDAATILQGMNLDLAHFDAVIVDLDGTLVDTLGDFTAALNAMLADLALPAVDAGVVETMVGKGSEHLVRSVLRHLRASDALYDQAFDDYQRYYGVVNGLHSKVYPGAVEGLRLLRDHRLRLACLTNKPTDFARQLLTSKRLDVFFDPVFGGDAFERKKPDPLPLLKTCEALGSRPGRTLMVGDSSNDARAARAAGCPVVLVTYGYNHGEPVQEVDADGFLDSLARLDSWTSPVGAARGLG